MADRDKADPGSGGDKRFVSMSQPTVNGNNSDQQPARATNGTHSEALTRLQSGYLRAMSALEARNKAFEQDLNNARAAQGSQNLNRDGEAAQRIANLEERNGLLQRELKVVRERSAAGQGIHQLQEHLAAKNQKIKEKNTHAVQKDQEIRSLRQELAEVKKRPTNVDPANAYIGVLQSQLGRMKETVNAKSNQVFQVMQENRRLQDELAEERRRGWNRGASPARGTASANGRHGSGNAHAWTGNSSHTYGYKKRKFEGAPGSQDNSYKL